MQVLTQRRLAPQTSHTLNSPHTLRASSHTDFWFLTQDFILLMHGGFSSHTVVSPHTTRRSSSHTFCPFWRAIPSKRGSHSNQPRSNVSARSDGLHADGPFTGPKTTIHDTVIVSHFLQQIQFSLFNIPFKQHPIP